MVVVAQRGEIGELARLMEVFNQATEKLALSYRKIGELQRELAEKERKLARKTRLETLGRMAASLAHEIRNPIAGIQLYAGLLRRDLAGDPEKGRAIDRILAAVSGLEGLVEDMLIYGRDLEPRRVSVELDALVGEALDLARATLEPKGIRVIRHGRGASVEADPEMLRRVFLNVIRNAAEAMEAGGALTVRASGPAVAFEDTGPGIPPEVMDRLFSPFVTTKAQGTGLGLAIAQKIVEAHGGALEAANLPKGGASFLVRL